MYRYIGLNASEERWAVFLGPGLGNYPAIALYSEVSPRKILELAPEPAVIGFYVATTVVMSAKHSESGEIVTLRSELKAASGIFFIDGVLYDQTRLRKELRDSAHLRSVLMTENLEHAVRTRNGDFVPFFKGRDQIIPA